jgi:hypothetical protein
MMKLWSPFHKKLCIAGIKLQSQLTRSSSGKLDALAYYWEPIFGEKCFDDEAADAFLDNYVPAFDFSQMPPPSV